MPRTEYNTLTRVETIVAELRREEKRLGGRHTYLPSFDTARRKFIIQCFDETGVYLGTL